MAKMLPCCYGWGTRVCIVCREIVPRSGWLRPELEFPVDRADVMKRPDEPIVKEALGGQASALATKDRVLKWSADSDCEARWVSQIRQRHGRHHRVGRCPGAAQQEAQGADGLQSFLRKVNDGEEGRESCSCVGAGCIVDGYTVGGARAAPHGRRCGDIDSIAAYMQIPMGRDRPHHTILPCHSVLVRRCWASQGFRRSLPCSSIGKWRTWEGRFRLTASTKRGLSSSSRRASQEASNVGQQMCVIEHLSGRLFHGRQGLVGTSVVGSTHHWSIAGCAHYVRLLGCMGQEIKHVTGGVFAIVDVAR